MSFDFFGENFNMKLDKQNATLKTSVGSLVSILVFIIVTVYAYIKCDVWIEKKDVDIMATELADYLPYDYKFDYDQGLNLAIAFTSFDNNPDPILDKSYGELIFNAYEWGSDENDNYFVR